jgi:hypothetical protein
MVVVWGRVRSYRGGCWGCCRAPVVLIVICPLLSVETSISTCLPPCEQWLAAAGRGAVEVVLVWLGWSVVTWRVYGVVVCLPRGYPLHRPPCGRASSRRTPQIPFRRGLLAQLGLSSPLVLLRCLLASPSWLMFSWFSAGPASPVFASLGLVILQP